MMVGTGIPPAPAPKRRNYTELVPFAEVTDYFDWRNDDNNKLGEGTFGVVRRYSPSNLPFTRRDNHEHGCSFSRSNLPLPTICPLARGTLQSVLRQGGGGA